MRGMGLISIVLLGVSFAASAEDFDPILKSQDTLGSVWDWQWHHGRNAKPDQCPGSGDGKLVIFNNGKIAFKGRYKSKDSDATYTDLDLKIGNWTFLAKPPKDD